MDKGDWCGSDHLWAVTVTIVLRLCYKNTIHKSARKIGRLGLCGRCEEFDRLQTRLGREILTVLDGAF
jgi:hypothetical protein